MFNQTDIDELIEILPVGRSNAIIANQIALLLGYPQGGNQVKTRQLISHAIENGAIILSSSGRHPKGYWTSNDILDVTRYVESLRSRSREISDRADAIITNWNNSNPDDTI